MRVLVLWAEPQSTNLGVRALGEGTAALASTVWPGAQIAFQGWGAGDAPVRIGNPRTVGREWVRRSGVLIDWLRGFDVVVDTRAGDSFADIYGLKRLVGMSAVTELTGLAGVPLVMGPQTIGPFGTRRGRAIGRRSLSRARTVMTRDPVSAETATSMGRAPDVRTTDVVFALPVPEPKRTHDVLVNVSGLLWNPNPHVDSAAYRQTVADLVRRFRRDGRSVALLAHVLQSDLADNDVPAARALAAVLEEEIEVLVPTSLPHVREVIASSRLVVGSRMHACLNALSVGVPAVPLAYSRKFSPLLSALGWDATVDLRTEADPVGAVSRLVADDGLGSRVEHTRQTAHHLLQEAGRALGRSV